MKKGIIVLLLLLLRIVCIFSQQSLTIEQESTVNHGISLELPENTPLKHFFQNGVVISKTDSEDNLGLSITILTETEIIFKGTPIVEKIYIIYSNLNEINVDVDDVVASDTIIGYSGGAGSKLHENTKDLYIYVYTEKFSPLMNQYTNNAYLKENDVYWWDPSFLLSH